METKNVAKFESDLVCEHLYMIVWKKTTKPSQGKIQKKLNADTTVQSINQKAIQNNSEKSSTNNLSEICLFNIYHWICPFRRQGAAKWGGYGGWVDGTRWKASWKISLNFKSYYCLIMKLAISRQVHSATQ